MKFLWILSFCWLATTDFSTCFESSPDLVGDSANLESKICPTDDGNFGKNGGTAKNDGALAFDRNGSVSENETIDVRLGISPLSLQEKRRICASAANGPLSFGDNLALAAFDFPSKNSFGRLFYWNDDEDRSIFVSDWANVSLKVRPGTKYQIALLDVDDCYLWLRRGEFFVDSQGNGTPRIKYQSAFQKWFDFDYSTLEVERRSTTEPYADVYPTFSRIMNETIRRTLGLGTCGVLPEKPSFVWEDEFIFFLDAERDERISYSCIMIFDRNGKIELMLNGCSYPGDLNWNKLHRRLTRDVAPPVFIF